MKTSFYAEMEGHEILRLGLEVIKYEHRDLDDAISVLKEKPGSDQLTVQRLKKRKLLLKDKITHLKD